MTTGGRPENGLTYPSGNFYGDSALRSLDSKYSVWSRLWFTLKHDLFHAATEAKDYGDYLCDLKHILKFKEYLETGDDDERIPFPLEALPSGPTWEDKMRHADNKGEALHKSVLGEARQSACSDCCCPLRRSAGDAAHNDVRGAP